MGKRKRGNTLCVKEREEDQGREEGKHGGGERQAVSRRVGREEGLNRGDGAIVVKGREKREKKEGEKEEGEVKYNGERG